MPQHSHHRFRNYVVFPILGFIALIVIFGAGAGTNQAASTVASGNGPAAPARQETIPTQPDGQNVKFEVTGGSKAASITYSTPGFGISQANAQQLPWATELEFHERWEPVSLTAQKGDSGSGPITCTVTINGHVVAQNHSDGPYAMTMCSTNGAMPSK